jgi:hypothetical protein
LMPASGHQYQTTSPSAFGAFVSRTIRVHRISPNVRDDGQRPLSRRDARSCRIDLPVGLSEIFCEQDWTAQIKLKRLDKSAF